MVVIHLGCHRNDGASERRILDDESPLDGEEGHRWGLPLPCEPALSSSRCGEVRLPWPWQRDDGHGAQREVLHVQLQLRRSLSAALCRLGTSGDEVRRVHPGLWRSASRELRALEESASVRSGIGDRGRGWTRRLLFACIGILAETRRIGRDASGADRRGRNRRFIPLGVSEGKRPRTFALVETAAA